MGSAPCQAFILAFWPHNVSPVGFGHLILAVLCCGGVYIVCKVTSVGQ